MALLATAVLGNTPPGFSPCFSSIHLSPSFRTLKWRVGSACAQKTRLKQGGIPRRCLRGKARISLPGKPASRVACWHCSVQRIRTPVSSIIRFTTSSSLTYPGFPLNYLLGIPPKAACRMGSELECSQTNRKAEESSQFHFRTA